MRLIFLLVLAAVIALALDYIHVSLMCPMMGHMCGFPSLMFPIFLTSTIAAAVVLYMYYSYRPVESRPSGLYRVVADLLKEPDRSIYLKLYEKGGEAQLAEIAKELGLRKLRAWRAAQRLAEKNLIGIEKRSGRLVLVLRPLDQLPIEPHNRHNYHSQEKHEYDNAK
ncbi:MAG: hypothetical protein QXP98_08395 [Thermoproteus sp.]